MKPNKTKRNEYPYFATRAFGWPWQYISCLFINAFGKFSVSPITDLHFAKRGFGGVHENFGPLDSAFLFFRNYLCIQKYLQKVFRNVNKQLVCCRGLPNPPDGGAFFFVGKRLLPSVRSVCSFLLRPKNRLLP